MTNNKTRDGRNDGWRCCAYRAAWAWSRRPAGSHYSRACSESRSRPCRPACAPRSFPSGARTATEAAQGSTRARRCRSARSNKQHAEGWGGAETLVRRLGSNDTHPSGRRTTRELNRAPSPPPTPSHDRQPLQSNDKIKTQLGERNPERRVSPELPQQPFFTTGRPYTHLNIKSLHRLA